MTNNPTKFTGLKGYGLAVIGRVSSFDTYALSLPVGFVKLPTPPSSISYMLFHDRITGPVPRNFAV